MNALSRISDALAATGMGSEGRAEPIYFDASASRLFGWLHRPPAHKQSDLGLVLCNPFGYEAICAHRGVRTFAEAAAAIGVPAIRFDYAGTGDSSDIDSDIDQIERWTADIVAAAAALRQRTGVKRVCLLGYRLGALLAAQAASESVDGLILIAPVINGKRYVRDLRVTQLAAALRADANALARDSAGGGVEVAGFSLSAASIATLSKFDLGKSDAKLPSTILVIDRPDLPVAKSWSEKAAGTGVQTKYLCLPGSVEMFLTAPQYGRVPDAMVTATRDWLKELQAASPSSDDDASSADVSSLPAILPLVGQGGAWPDISERPVFFGTDVTLFGILSEPNPSEAVHRGVILINAAVDPHFGAGRVYVSLARSWARRGYVVLRMDLAGIADSATRKGRADDEVFTPEALTDIRAAIDFLSTRCGVQEVSLAGLCSGGYHALRAAVARLPVRQIFVINPENYFWKQGTALQDVQLAEAIRNPAIYRARVQSAAAWGRLLTGRVNVWRICKIYVQRAALAVESALRDTARALHIRLPSDLGSELEELCARGVRVVFVFARNEPGIALLKLLAGSTIPRLAGSCRVHIIDGGDHTFSTRGPRESCEAILTDELTGVGRTQPIKTIPLAAATQPIRALREKPP
jgi:dienelactone hydrolase